MCTVSWIHEDGGYQLLCNRDEQRTRRRALPPGVRQRQGVSYIAPMDGDFGGTWIAANEFGVTLCLLNAVAKEPMRGGPFTSRGLLLPELMSSKTVWEAGERVWDRDLSPFAPFTIAALEPGEPAMVMEWDGVEKAVIPYAEPLLPLTSSSYESRAVAAARRRDFASKCRNAGKVDADALYFFHESHNGRPDAFSTCMHRPDAETVSFSWVRVTPEEVDFFYSPEAPCRFAPGRRTCIRRKNSSHR